jgi:hypothetical protein
MIRLYPKKKHWWLMPVIIATLEAGIRRITVQGPPKQILCKTLSPKNNQSKMDWRCISSHSVSAFASIKP